MKTDLDHLFVLLLLACLVPGCSTTKEVKPAARRDASDIEQILIADRRWQQSISAEIDTIKHDPSPPYEVPKHRNPGKILACYIEAHRRAISPDWPRDFQLAYLQNLQAWECLKVQLEQEPAKDGGIEILLGIGLMAFGGPPVAAIPPIGKGLSKSADAERQRLTSENAAACDVVETWQKVEQAAIQCDARLNAQSMSAYLGIETLPITPKYSQAHRLRDPAGALIVAARAQSPASNAQIQGGDIVKSFNEEIVMDHLHLLWLIARTVPNSQVHLVVERSSKLFGQSITLREQPAATK